MKPEKNDTQSKHLSEILLAVFVIISICLGCTLYIYISSNSKIEDQAFLVRDDHSLRAEITLISDKSKNIGYINMIDTLEGMYITGKINNLSPGSSHGIHILEFSDVSLVQNMKINKDMLRLYNPRNLPHECININNFNEETFHGDLGNLVANSKGEGFFNLNKKGRVNSLAGRTIVITKRSVKCENQKDFDKVAEILGVGILAILKPTYLVKTPNHEFIKIHHSIQHNPKPHHKETKAHIIPVIHEIPQIQKEIPSRTQHSRKDTNSKKKLKRTQEKRNLNSDDDLLDEEDDTPKKKHELKNKRRNHDHKKIVQRDRDDEKTKKHHGRKYRNLYLKPNIRKIQKRNFQRKIFLKKHYSNRNRFINRNSRSYRRTSRHTRKTHKSRTSHVDREHRFQDFAEKYRNIMKKNHIESFVQKSSNTMSPPVLTQIRTKNLQKLAENFNGQVKKQTQNKISKINKDKQVLDILKNFKVSKVDKNAVFNNINFNLLKNNNLNFNKLMNVNNLKAKKLIKRKFKRDQESTKNNNINAKIKTDDAKLFLKHLKAHKVNIKKLN